MRKAEQKAINERVIDIVSTYDIERRLVKHECGTRLRSCSAEVVMGKNGFWLRSYRTIVAFIPYSPSFDYDMPCYDFLRYVYGYTATSAQHIAKFADDYGNGKVLSYKEV